MDYVTANPNRVENLLQLHTELIVASVMQTIARYPCLRRKPIRVFIERNTSHAHAAFIAKCLDNRFRDTDVTVVVEKESSKDGREKTGIWTRNKDNLIHMAQLLLERNNVALAEHVVSVADSLSGTKGSEEDVIKLGRDAKRTLRSQLADFRRIIRTDGKQNITGKLKNVNDDLAMSFVLWLAWSCFPFER